MQDIVKCRIENGTMKIFQRHLIFKSRDSKFVLVSWCHKYSGTQCLMPVAIVTIVRLFM